MRLSLSARDSSDELRWYVTLLTPFFFVVVSVVTLLWPMEFFANVALGVVIRHRATVQAKTVCNIEFRSI
ncbi:MAG: hypothetical protein K2X78_11425 [Burkholderiaceae bacterium]|nr:hypothetical protein [Burkholderiaceae bacterium]